MTLARLAVRLGFVALSITKLAYTNFLKARKLPFDGQVDRIKDQT